MYFGPGQREKTKEFSDEKTFQQFTCFVNRVISVEIAEREKN